MIQNLATTTTITTTTTSKETQRVHTHNQQAATYPTPIATDEKKPIIIRFSVPKKKTPLLRSAETRLPGGLGPYSRFLA
jgi:hypothetical protein